MGRRRRERSLGRRKTEQVLKERVGLEELVQGPLKAMMLAMAFQGLALHLNPRIHLHKQCLEGQDDKQDVMRT